MNNRCVGLFLGIVVICMISPLLLQGGMIGQTIVDYDNGRFSPQKEMVLSAGESWLDGWAYRKEITITGVSGSGTGYQIEFDVNYGGGADSGNSIFCWSKCQTDFDDIRFTDDDGSTLLDYYIREYGASGDSEMWVEVTDSLESSATIYMYYGNDGVADVSNGDDTFYFFDDFEDNDLSEWRTTGGWAIDSGTVRYGTYSAYGQVGDTALATPYDMYGGANFTVDFCVDYWARSNDDDKIYVQAVVTDEGTGPWDGVAQGNDLQYYDGTYYDYGGSDQWNPDTWYHLEWYGDMGASADTWTVYMNDNELTANPSIRSNGDGNVAEVCGFYHTPHPTYTDDDLFLDSYFVRKWNAAGEPAPSSYGSEEDTTPENEVAAACTNLDDTDNMYAKYRVYIFKSNVTDGAGFGDLDYVELSLWSGAAALWTIKFDEDTETFSESLDANNYITLETGSCSNVSSGDTLDITWAVSIHWNHTDVVDYDLKQYVVDNGSLSDTDTYDVNYDVETRLDWSVVPTLSDGTGNTTRGDYDTVGGITASGTLIYYGSSDDNPPDVVDVYVSCGDVAGSPWGDTSLSSGAFSVLVDSDDVVGLDTYTFKPVEEGAGAGGTSLYYTTDVTDDYVADRFQLVDGNTLDSRDDINDESTIYIEVIYDYDDVTATTGTIDETTHSVTFSPSGGYYYGYQTETIVIANTYETFEGNADDTYGLTKVDTNGNGVTVIWDRIQVVGYTDNSTDDRDNINDYVNVTVQLIYDYDDVAVTTGTITINGESAAHIADGYWYVIVTKATAQLVTFNQVESTGNAYALTEEDQNGQSFAMVWDSLTITITGPTDNRQNLNANATGMIVSAVYDYDSSAFDGLFTLNNTDYDGDGTVTIWYYTVQSVSGDSYNITAISTNDDAYMIWDSLTISFYISDQRINVNDNATITVSAWYDYDNASIAGGYSFILNDTTYDYGTVGIYYYTVNSVSGDTYGITTISANDNDYVIFDQAEVYYVWCEDGQNRTSYGTTVTIRFRVRLQYDNHILDDGSNDTVLVNASSCTWLTDHWYRLVSYDAVLSHNFAVSAISEDSYGITALDSASASNLDVDIIWDRALWQSIANVNTTQDYGGDGYRVDIGTYVNITILMYYEYDSSAITDGTILLNGESMIHIANGYWYLIVQNGTAAYGQDYTFNTITADSNTYDIEVENQNGQSMVVIWDEIFIYEDGCDYLNTFDRVNVGQNVTIWANAKLRYDNDTLGSGDYLEFGDEQMSWNGTHFTASYTRWDVGNWTFTINTTLSYEDSYGITMGSNIPVNVTFDRILIYNMWVDSFSSPDNRTSYGTAALIYASLVSEYDNESMAAGLVQINGTLDTETGGDLNMTFDAGSNWYKSYTYSSVMNYTFLITFANWTTYNLTEINYNGWNVTYIYSIWDQIIVRGYNTNSTDGRDNIGTYVNVSVWLQYDWDDTNVTDGTIVINGDSFSYLADWNWTAVFMNSTVSGTTWDTVVASGNYWGVTSVNQNSKSQTYIWDQLIVRGYNTNSTDDRDDISTYVNVSIWIQYDYDDANVTDGTTVVNGDSFSYLVDWNWTAIFMNSTVSDVTWDTVVCSGNTYGITSVNQNSKSLTYIWDQIIVRGYGTNSTDDRDNINTYVNTTVWLQYDWDDTNVTDGTVVINGDSFSYLEQGNWSAVFQNTSVSDATWDAVDTSGNTHGITSVNQNSQSYTYIWDQIIVRGYSTNSTDDRDAISTYVNISVWLQYDFDDANVTDGTVAVNGQAFVYDSASNWTAVFMNSTVGGATWNTVVVNGNYWDITSVNQNSKSLTYIWDRLYIDSDVYWTSYPDTRVDSDSEEDFYFIIRYEYDDVEVTTGTQYMNGYSLTGGYWLDAYYRWIVNWAYQTEVQAIVWETFTTDGDDTYGISEVVNDYGFTMIWDAIGINYTSNYYRLGVDNNVQINAYLYYQYDYTQVTDGSVSLNGSAMTWDTDHWEINVTKSTRGIYGYQVSSISGNTYGITDIGFVGFVASTDYATDLSITVDNNLYKRELLGFWIYWYDDGGDYNLTVFSGSVGVFIKLEVHSAGETDYVHFGDGYYEKTIELTDVDISFGEWYFFEIKFNHTDIPMVYVARNIYIYVNGQYAGGEAEVLTYYDFTLTTIKPVSSEDIFLLASVIYYEDSIADETTNYFNKYELMEFYCTGEIAGYTPDRRLDMTTVDMENDWWYDQYAASNDANMTYGMVTAWATNPNLVHIIFDRINVTVSVNVTWLPINEYYANVSYTLVYDYDGLEVTGNATIANTTMTTTDSVHWEEIVESVVGNYTFYAIEVLDDIHGITDFYTNTAWCVWDNVTANVYYYVTKMTSTTNLFNVFMENVTFEYNGTYLSSSWILMAFANATWKINATCDGTGYTTPATQVITVDSADSGILYTNNATVVVDGTTYNFQWYEVEADVAEDLNIQVETQEILDEDVVVSGTTNVNFNYTVYEENSSIETGEVIGSGDQWGWKITFDLNQSYGWHNFSIYFDAGESGARWYNSSYFYEDWDWVYINIIGPNALGLDPILFQIRTNDTRIWSGNPRFWARTDASYNISITNFLNETVSEATYSIPSDRIIDININVYILTVYSQLEEEFIYFNLTSSAGATWSEHIAPRHTAKIAIYASTDYTYEFTCLTGGSAGTFSGTINVDYDYGIIVSGYNLVTIWRGVQEIGTGSMSAGEVLSVLQSAYGPVLGQIQFFSWIMAIMMFIGLFAVPFLSKKAKGQKILDTGFGGELSAVDISGMPTQPKTTTKRKQPVPKQLEPHKFKKGPANPQYRGGKGKKKKDDKGTLEDMSDFMWDKIKKGRGKR